MPIATPDTTAVQDAVHGGPDPQAARRGFSLRRWSSPEWQAVRHAAHHTLVDMYVHPALSREGAPLPNALRHDAVEHGLIDAVTGRPTHRLLWLNPGLQEPRR